MNSTKGRCRALVRCLVPWRVRQFTEAGWWAILLRSGVRPVVAATAQFAGSAVGWYSLDTATRWVQVRLLAHPLILSSGEFGNCFV